MSGGGERGGRAGRARYGAEVTVNTKAVQNGLAAAPQTRGAADPIGGKPGVDRTPAPGKPAEPPAAAAKPVSQGPSGEDTTAGKSDDAPAAAAASRVPASRRKRLARGGGLSNVLFGGATLG